MKKKEIKMILTIIVIGVLIIAGLAMLKNSKTNKGNEENENTVDEKYVNVLADGTKLNTSNKLNKTRKVDGIEISGIQLTHKNGISVLLATARNVSEVDKGMTVIEITLYDDKNNILEIVEGIVSPVKAGESTQINMGLSADYANAYDFTVKSK